jgi:hypothetical protein
MDERTLHSRQLKSWSSSSSSSSLRWIQSVDCDVTVYIVWHHQIPLNVLLFIVEGGRSLQYAPGFFNLVIRRQISIIFESDKQNG